MARNRRIHPSFFKDGRLAECSPEARVFLLGLWCCADDEEQVEFSPAQLKAQIFPADDIDVAALVDELHAQGFVERFRADGRHWLRVIYFSRPLYRRGRSAAR